MIKSNGDTKGCLNCKYEHFPVDCERCKNCVETDDLINWKAKREH